MKPKLIRIACLLLGVLWAGSSFADCIQDPTGYWTLDEESPPFANSVLEGPAASCTGTACPVVDAAGIVGNAQAFNGTSSRVSVADDGVADFDFENTESFSIGVWFKRDASAALTSNEVMVGRYQFGQLQLWVGLGTSGRAAFLLWDNVIYGNTSDIGTVIGTSTNLADNQWHYIVAVRDAQNGQNIIYVDGNMENSIQITYSGSLTANAPLTFGWMNSSVDPYAFNGSIDEVTLFDSALSGDVINQIYNAGIQGIGICDEEDSGALSISSTAPTNATVGTEYVYNPIVNNPGGETLTWSLSEAPTDMDVDSATGRITWTPAAGTTTSGLFSLIVTDSTNNTASEDILINVSESGSSDGGSDGSDSGDDDGGSSGGGGCFILSIFPVD